MTGIDLKVKRIYRRLTLKQLADKMNRSTGWLSALENKDDNLTPEQVVKYMSALENYVEV